MIKIFLCIFLNSVVFLNVVFFDFFGMSKRVEPRLESEYPTAFSRTKCIPIKVMLYGRTALNLIFVQTRNVCTLFFALHFFPSLLLPSLLFLCGQGVCSVLLRLMDTHVRE